MAKPSWITLDKTSGSKDGTVTVTASEHTGRVNRTGEITFTSSNNVVRTVAVEQTGAALTFAAAGNVATLDSDKGSHSAIPVEGGIALLTFSKSNAKTLGISWISGQEYVSSHKLVVGSTEDTSWDNTSNDEVTGDPGADAEYSGEIQIIIGANSDASERSFQFVVLYGDGSSTKTYTESYSFTQDGADSSLSVSPTSLSFSAAGESKSVAVTSNDSWTVS